MKQHKDMYMYNRRIRKIYEVKEPSRGVFWVKDDDVIAFPFSDNGNLIGISNNGLTFNHKRLWKILNIENKPYNYYPRGRVDFNNKGKPIIWINPNIKDTKIINKIKTEFGLREEPKINLDYSDHYKCYLDDGWKPDRS